MKYKSRRALFALLFGLLASGATFLWWSYSDTPQFIPYREWTAPQYPMPLRVWSEPDSGRVLLRTEDILNSDDFAFAMGAGSGMYGYDVFRIDASGNASYYFSNGNSTWWKASFQLTDAELVALRLLLVDVGYPSLDRSYHAAICDGTQWVICVDAGGVTKKVYCDNSFPDAAVRLASAIGREILSAHKSEVEKARRIWQFLAHDALDGLTH